MVSFPTAIALSLLAGLVASKTTTVFPDDKRIKYNEHSWTKPTVCEYKDGKVVPNPEGCFNLGAKPCADRIQLAQNNGANLTFTFKGTGITLNSLSQPSGLEGIVTISLDGKDSSYDSNPNFEVLKCETNRFNADGLAKDKEHTVTVTLRTAHEDGNPPSQDGSPLFFFAGFTITGAEDSTTTSGGSSTTGKDTTTTAKDTTTSLRDTTSTVKDTTTTTKETTTKDTTTTAEDTVPASDAGPSESESATLPNAAVTLTRSGVVTGLLVAAACIFGAI